ncbi:MAG: TIGR02302 family protein [Notoacmeibacter sp.]
MASTPDTIISMIAKVRRTAGRSMLFERFWPRLLPLIIIVALYAIVAWFGVFRVVPDWVRIGLGVGFGVSALISFGLLFGLRRPTQIEIDRRLELDNALQHQPVATQSETLAQGGGDPFAEALWSTHRQRLSAKLNNLKVPLPKPDIPARDPFALRAIVAVGVITAFAFSWGSGGGKLTDVMQSYASFNTPPPRIDVWVNAPTYTRKPPLYLTGTTSESQEPSTANVPVGSTVTVRVTGGYGEPALAFTSAEIAEPLIITPKKDNAAGQVGFEFELKTTGQLALTLGGKPIENWAFTIIPDNRPEIAFAKPAEDAIKSATNGALELNYAIKDDYGAVSANGVLALLPDDQLARPLYEMPELKLTLPSNRGEGEARFAAKTTKNFTDHPFAGRDVSLSLEAIDAAGQKGLSEAKTIVLPSKVFANPLAKAIVEQRQILALNADDQLYIQALLEAILLRPEDFIKNAGHYLALTTISTRLEMAETDDEYRAVADYMWEVALGMESGNLSAAEQRLQQAKQALRDALQNGASEEEIAKAIEELREAMNDYLREFAENARRNPQSQQNQNPNAQAMQPQDLDKMLDQMKELSEQGAKSEAEQLLSQLEDMLNNLQMAQPGQQGQQGQQGQAQRQMNELGEILQQQQELMDQTQRAERQQRQGDDGQEGEQGENGEGQGEQGQQGQGQQGQGQQGGQGQGQGFGELGEGQRGLQDRLGKFMDGLKGSGIEPGEEFGQAQGSMGEAGESLGDGDGQSALGEQGEALDALRRGAESMMQQLQQQAGQGDNGGSEGNGQRQMSDDRDPLGRPRATTGPDFGSTVKVPGEIDIQRAREILEAIRKRLGDSLSPDLEKKYLERLLDFEK